MGLVLTAVFGCNDRRRPAVIQLVPDEDMGIDLADEDMSENNRLNEIECRGKVDGQSCDYQRGVGICVRGVCQRVACEFGYADCNEDRIDGCETATSENDNCGACGNVCEAPTSCQAGRFGYACGAGILCPSDGVDFDFDGTNGCEWTISNDDPVQLIPGDVEIQVAGVDAQQRLIAAGVLDDTRFSSTPSGFAPLTSVTGASQAVDVSVFRAEVVSVWPDAVIAIDDQAQERVADFQCKSPPVFEAGEGAFVVSADSVYRLGECSGDICPLASFDRHAYIQAFSTGAEYQFGSAELAQCDTCITDGNTVIQRECVTPTCVRPTFDETPCTGCEPTGCPDFAPVDIAVSSALPHVYVLTTRGWLALSNTDFTPVYRAEFAFDPGVASGAAFERIEVSHADGVDVVSLIGADSYVSVGIDNAGVVTPRVSPVGFDLNDVPLFAASSNGLVALGTVDQFVVGSTGPLSGRVLTITNPELDGVFDRRIVGVVGETWGVGVIYQGAGSLYLQRLQAPEP